MYDDGDIRAEGYIASADIDIVYTWEEPRPEWVVFNGHLTGAAIDVRDAPRGALITRLSPRQPLEVELLQRRGDAVLVRVRGRLAAIVGWVDGAHYGPRPESSVLRRPKGGGGGVRFHGADRMTLAAGTLLVGAGHTLGVVKRTETFFCAGPCTAPGPRVKIRCGYTLRLRPVRPECPQ